MMTYVPIGLDEGESRKEKWPEDLCDCRKRADEILAFARVQTRPLTVALDGRWGSGKSFFVRGFAKHVEEGSKDRKPGLCVLLNAWESDALDNPLLYLYYGVSKAIERMPQYDVLDQNVMDVLKKNFSEIGKELLNTATAGIFGRLNDAFKKNCNEHPVSQYDGALSLQRRFKEYLAGIAEQVQQHSGCPLIVCVDELDRCKPTYAIEMLECIKHFFSVPHTMFLLSVDLPELRSVIQASYGCLNPREYLRRFVQYVFPLPVLPAYVYVCSVWKNLELDAVVTAQIANPFPARKFNSNEVLRYFKLVLSTKDYTPRQVESLLRMFAVGMSDCVYQYVDCVLLAILCIAYLDDPKSFDGLVSGHVDIKELSLKLVRQKESEPALITAVRAISQFVIAAGWAVDSSMIGKIYSDFRKWGESAESCPAELRPLAEKILANLSIGVNGWHRTFSDARVQELSHRFNFVSTTNTDWAAGAN